MNGAIGREEVMREEIWFSIAYSIKGTGDWFETADSFDTIQDARTELNRPERRNDVLFEYQIIKKTLSTEAVS